MADREDLPDTIENRWDRLYREFPEVYHAFSGYPYEPDPVEVLAAQVDLRDAVVLEVGSGTGRSAGKLARHCRRVIGVEPEPAMRRIAERELAAAGTTEAKVLDGTKENIPLPSDSVDAVVSVTAGLDVPEAVRVVREGGPLASLDIAPGHYGGDLAGVIGIDAPELAEESRRLVELHGFSVRDFESVQDYGSTDAIVATYGFIFGRRAVEHLRRTGKTTITWRFRLHLRGV